MTTYGRVLLSEPSTRGTWCNHPLMEAPWGFMLSRFVDAHFADGIRVICNSKIIVPTDTADPYKGIE